MGLISEVATKAGIAVRKSGSLELIVSSDAEAFLTQIGIDRLVVLGIEGFRIENDLVIPDMDAIACFDSEPGLSSEESISASRRFLKAISNPGVFFEFQVAKGDCATAS